MTAAELAGFELPGAVELPAHIEHHYLRRIRELPEATQNLMLVAAAEPLGDRRWSWRQPEASTSRPTPSSLPRPRSY